MLFSSIALLVIQYPGLLCLWSRSIECTLGNSFRVNTVVLTGAGRTLPKERRLPVSTAESRVSLCGGGATAEGLNDTHDICNTQLVS